MFNYSQFQQTGNKAIDMVANIIGCARENRQAVKALHLKPIIYEWFKSGVQTLMDRPLRDGEFLQFDGVNIEKGSRLQLKDIQIEYYEQVQA